MEAKLGNLFVNDKQGKLINCMLYQMGKPQSFTLNYYNDSSTAGIANESQEQCSRSIKMRYCWVAAHVECKNFTVCWHPGKENLPDYHISIIWLNMIPKTTGTISALINHQPKIPESMDQASCKGVLKWCPWVN